MVVIIITVSLINRMINQIQSTILTARADSGEERTEITVKSSFKLDLPPHLIISSSSVKILKTIGQGIIFAQYIALCCVNLCAWML